MHARVLLLHSRRLHRPVGRVVVEKAQSTVGRYIGREVLLSARCEYRTPQLTAQAINDLESDVRNRVSAQQSHSLACRTRGSGTKCGNGRNRGLLCTKVWQLSNSIGAVTHLQQRSWAVLQGRFIVHGHINRSTLLGTRCGGAHPPYPLRASRLWHVRRDLWSTQW